MIEHELGFRNSNFTVFLNLYRDVSGGPCHPGTHYPDPQSNEIVRESKNSNNTKVFTIEEHF